LQRLQSQRKHSKKQSITPIVVDWEPASDEYMSFDEGEGEVFSEVGGNEEEKVSLKHCDFSGCHEA